MRYLLILFLAIFSVCFSGIETSYKKALHKRNYHSIGGIDYIYMINAHDKISRFRNQKKAFDRFDIIPYRFDSINPDKLSLKTMYNVGYTGKSRDFKRKMLGVKKLGRNYTLLVQNRVDESARFFDINTGKEDIARSLDFLSIIHDAYKSKYSRIWIMEDDVSILNNPNLLTGYLIELQSIDYDWDILYTDADEVVDPDAKFRLLKRLHRPDVDLYSATKGFEFNKYRGCEVRKSCGSFLVNRHGMRKILAYYSRHKLFLPMSIELPFIPGLHVYELLVPVVVKG